MQDIRRQYIFAQRRNQRIKQSRRTAYSIGQRRALQINALAGINAGLAVQWLMIGIFGHQHMSEKAGAWLSPLNRQ